MLKESITILLQTASVDALARLRSGSAMCDEETKDSAFNIYFDQQNHFSLIDCLRNCLIDCSNVAMIQVHSTNFFLILIIIIHLGNYFRTFTDASLFI